MWVQALTLSTLTGGLGLCLEISFCFPYNLFCYHIWIQISQSPAQEVELTPEEKEKKEKEEKKRRKSEKRAKKAAEKAEKERLEKEKAEQARKASEAASEITENGESRKPSEITVWTMLCVLKSHWM